MEGDLEKDVWGEEPRDLLSWANQLFLSLSLKNIEIETELLSDGRRLWDGHPFYLICMSSSQCTVFNSSTPHISQYPGNTNSTGPGHPGCHTVPPALSERADVFYPSNRSHTTGPTSVTWLPKSYIQVSLLRANSDISTTCCTSPFSTNIC